MTRKPNRERRREEFLAAQRRNEARDEVCVLRITNPVIRESLMELAQTLCPCDSPRSV